MNLPIISILAAIAAATACDSFKKAEKAPDTPAFNTANEAELKAKLQTGAEIIANLQTAFSGNSATLRLIDDRGDYEFSNCKIVIPAEEMGGSFREESCDGKDKNGKTVICKVLRINRGNNETTVATSSDAAESSSDWQVANAQCDNGTATESPNLGPNTENPEIKEVTTTSSSNESAELAGMLASGGKIDDCDTAFSQIESIYDDVESQYQQFTKLLQDPTSVAQSGAKLEKLPPDGNYINRYAYATAESQDGFAISGIIGGGANDNEIRLHQDMKMMMDLGKLFGSISPETKMPIQKSQVRADIIVELNSSTITMAMNYELVIEGATTTTMLLDNQVTVGGGEEKFVEQKANLATSGENASTTATSIRAKLIDGNNIEVIGKIGAEDFNYLIKRNDSGCDVEKR